MNLLKIPSFTASGHVQGVIEIPAGTNRKYEIDKQTGVMYPDIRDGKPRMVDFLPYPMNYGFVPSTIMDKERGGDGDPLDILYIAESVPNSTVVEAIPIGLLLLKEMYNDKEELEVEYCIENFYLIQYFTGVFFFKHTAF